MISMPCYTILLAMEKNIELLTTLNIHKRKNTNVLVYLKDNKLITIVKILIVYSL